MKQSYPEKLRLDYADFCNAQEGFGGVFAIILSADRKGFPGWNYYPIFSLEEEGQCTESGFGNSSS
ncbi:hypothetical protein [Parasphingorhabdus sp.]|uniref:hypothetical protein n=1 Tax=Parasphingorhabdus sp. TaxID=2709688 RepID=UPI0030019686